MAKKGEAYATAHARPYGCPQGVEPHTWRQALESRAERHLSLAAALIAMLDVMDGDPDLEHDGSDYEDGGDDEPSLGSVGAGAGGYVEPLGFWKVKPYWMDADAWQASLRRHDSVTIVPVPNWAQGNRDDKEHEHDGVEPENEHGPSWAEGRGSRGSLFSGSGEDDEPSLGLTEHVNQVTRTVTAGWAFDDCEGDYAVECWPGGPNNRARMADDEPDATDLESDGLERGEHDDSELDSGARIGGGGYHV